MMGAGNLAAADEAATSRAAEMTVRGLPTRRAGGRLFVERAGVWTDAAHHDSLRVVEVAPFSGAYFQLVRALPELAPALQAGETVLVAGRRVSVKITAGGMTAWPYGQLPAVVRAFRGA
jgi:hypothetical protein